MPPLPGLIVARSSIHGYGLIAARRFAEGEIVTYGDGVLYKEDDDFVDSHALVLPGDNGDPSWPADEDGELPNFYYDLVDQTRWINHSCDPNTDVDARWDPEARIVRTWWTALRDIEPGEEIFYHYAFCAAVAEPCNCGTDECNGLIIDPDEVDELPEALRVHLRTPAASRAS
ncbi:MAG: SET domain-containing protein-lysine N-methyltransferase [Myxococcales bacterium]|nr:SET domain-containing protein-lysine N-methyltransferase [Myxococcales bacterium]